MTTILTNDYINLLAQTELKGKIASGCCDFDCEDDGRYAMYEYDIDDIIDAVVEDLVQHVDTESEAYQFIVDIIDERVKDAIDEEKLDDIARYEAIEAEAEERHQRLLRQDFYANLGV